MMVALPVRSADCFFILGVGVITYPSKFPGGCLVEGSTQILAVT